MPAVKDDAPVKIAMAVQKDGQPVQALVPAAPFAKPGPGGLFARLANTRRTVPEPPPPRPQIFNPVAPRPAPSEDSSGYLDEEEGSEEDEGSEDSRGFRGMEEDAERIKAMKSECLQKLHRYTQQGFPVPEHLGMRSSLEELQGECDRIKRGIDTQNAIRFQRRCLVTFVTGVEWVNGEFDPIGTIGGPTPQLQGWSASIMSEIDSFDSVFERLYDKYRHRAQMPPELELMLTLIMSAMAFHMQNVNPKTFPVAQPRHPPPPQRAPGTEPTRPTPPPQPQPPPPPPPPRSELTRETPDPPPYVMQGPSGLGGLPGFSPLPIGGSGPPVVAVAVPPGSAEDFLRPPELVVPPRDVPPGTIEELPPSPTPSRKRAAPPKKKRAAPSEGGVAL